jgi:hypothetical protein
VTCARDSCRACRPVGLPPLVGGIAGGIIDGLLWLWMAWKTGAGRGWARVLSTVFFGFYTSSISRSGSTSGSPIRLIAVIRPSPLTVKPNATRTLP